MMSRICAVFSDLYEAYTSSAKPAAMATGTVYICTTHAL